jgi:flagellar assembly factor FliW
MILNTRHFGVVAIDEGEAVEFPQGLPGFEECRHFALLDHPARAGLVFLQSLERPEVCFVAVPVRAIRPGYELSLAPDDLELLGWPSDFTPEIGRDVIALAIVSFEENQAPTANLLAPVVIDVATRRAVQAIRSDGGYGCREPLGEECGDPPPQREVACL